MILWKKKRNVIVGLIVLVDVKKVKNVLVLMKTANVVMTAIVMRLVNVVVKIKNRKTLSLFSFVVQF